jgi:molybdate-binding protein/DNA-binding XRE family transcriptional regulator
MPEQPLRNNLKQVRTSLGLSQQDLAAMAGVTRQSVGGIEAGQYAPSATVALRLARALGCRVEELFWLDEDLPEITARVTAPVPAGEAVRVSLARVGGNWMAHPLVGEAAFRTELIPADGVGIMESASPAAAPAPTMRIRPLDDPENLQQTVVLAGCSPALSLWARAAERWHPGLRVPWVFANSMAGLERLARGEVHAAGLHLYDPETGEFNAPFVRRHLPGKAAVLINLGVWEEGFLVRAGNPVSIRQAADLARPGVRFLNREPGAGSRQLLEHMLTAAGVPAGAVKGFGRVACSHTEVARAVAAGEADAGVSTASVAAAFGLDFVPIHRVRYDMVFLKAYLEEPPVRQLIATLSHRWVRSQLETLGGYDTNQTGEVVATIE